MADLGEDVMLVAATDADFAAMLAGNGPLRGNLRQPPGGVDDPEVLAHVRRLAAGRGPGREFGHWMIVVAGEIVGLCGFHARPNAAGEVELGYGVAAARRNRGHARSAVAAVIAAARQDPEVRAILASTATANRVSQRVLERNGFVRAGTRGDPEDGPLLLWRKEL